MCLYPRRIINKKYTVTEKNGGCVPLPPIIGRESDGTPIYDERVLYVNVPCGQCVECRKTKSREWQIRLAEEIKQWEKSLFVTLTFDPVKLRKLMQETNIDTECNAVCGYAVRHFLERWRKKYKKSVKHWFVVELGHYDTERIHLHGIIFKNIVISKEELEKIWMYGNIWVGDYCNIKTVNYIVKYMNKIDTDHKGFYGQVFASPGLGKSWIDRQEMLKYKYRQGKTIDYYRLESGNKVKLPKYYKNKIYSDDDKERIWRDFMDTERISITGTTYDRDISDETLENVLSKAKEVNMRSGYGNEEEEWRKKRYNITKRMLEHNTTEWKQERAEKIKKKAEQALLQNIC